MSENGEYFSVGLATLAPCCSTPMLVTARCERAIGVLTAGFSSRYRQPEFTARRSARRGRPSARICISIRAPLQPRAPVTDLVRDAVRNAHRASGPVTRPAGWLHPVAP